MIAMSIIVLANSCQSGQDRREERREERRERREERREQRRDANGNLIDVEVPGAEVHV